MNKKVIVAITVVVIVVSVMAVAMGFSSSKPDFSEEELEEMILEEAVNAVSPRAKIGIFKLDSLSELEDFVTENQLILQKSDDSNLLVVGGIDVLGQSAEMFIQTNPDGSFLRVDGNCSVKMDDKKSLEELTVRINRIAYVISEIFEIESVDYSIFDKDGAEIISETENLYEKILNDNASFGLSVVDKDGSYWNCKAFLEKDVIKIEFFHSYQKDLYEFESANIVLN